MTRFWIACWFALGRLPFPVYRALTASVCALLTLLLLLFAAERRRVAMTNLALCFPEKSFARRLAWTARHIHLYLQTFLDRGWLWQADPAVVRSRVRVLNPEALAAVDLATPTIFLAPHFLGLDAAWTRLCLDIDMVTMYSNQKNPSLNSLILNGRSRLGAPLLLSRQQGIRPLISAMRQGKPLYYLPDMDFGERDSVFVTFFGVQAATVTAVARLSKMLKAQVVPVTTRYVHGRYDITVHPPLANFPREDEVESTQAINHAIESWVLDNTVQYLWLHKRFKTRPEGQPRIY